MYYLVKFSKDWADEFTVYGFSIFKKEEWDALYLQLVENKNNAAGSMYFGTNEGWDDETIGDFLNDIEVKAITNEEKKIINKLFGKEEYGIFPNFQGMLNPESDDDED